MPFLGMLRMQGGWKGVVMNGTGKEGQAKSHKALNVLLKSCTPLKILEESKGLLSTQ